MAQGRREAAALALLFFVGACGSPTDSNGGGGSTTGHLPGSPGAAAGPAVPTIHYQARPQDYSPHPDIGLNLSFNTAIITLRSTATVGQVNRLLDSLQAEIVGGVKGTSQVGGVAIVRLSTTTHAQMDAAVAALASHPLIESLSEDVVLGTTAIARPTSSTLPLPWTWELTPQGGNWGLEASRVPQMWNWEPFLVRTGRHVSAGVIDVGFFSGSEDLFFQQNLAPTVTDDHGTHVAGIIGAAFDNGKGIDGVCPVCDLTVAAPPLHILSLAQDVITGLPALLAADPTIRVVNLSLAYNWYQFPTVALPLSASDAAWVTGQGKVVADGVAALAATGVTLPVMVVAAGNDGVVTSIPTQTATPLANAALVHGSAPFIVVESDSLTPQGTIVRSDFSDTGGHLSAPGSQIESTVGNGAAYGIESGTSMASPFVTGVVAMLYALDPTLPAPTPTTNPVLALLQSSAIAVSGRPPRIDAFRAVVALGDSVVKRLADIDDGSVDGNLRADSLGITASADTHGDGEVDMADFRRWRDWLLQLENANGLSLDGGPANPKKDLNGDGQVGLSSAEALYPRGDFNGDGLLLRATTAVVTGPFGATPVTDLQVLQRYFHDPDYAASDLPGLVDSGDLSVEAGACLLKPGVVRVRSLRTISGSNSVLEQREHDLASPTEVYTLPVDFKRYKITVEALDASDVVLGVDTVAVVMQLGRDIHFGPACDAFRISTDTLPRAGVARAYAATLAASNAPDVVTWTIVVGQLPSGLSLQTDGHIVGTATVAGSFTIMIQAASGGLVTTKTYTFQAGQDLTGTWNGTFSFELNSGDIATVGVTAVLSQTGTNITGGYDVGDGAHFGDVSANIIGTVIGSFLLAQQPGCPGTFTGTGEVSADGSTIIGNFGGGDCHNTHSGGGLILHRQ